jgi:hypothetical protein
MADENFDIISDLNGTGNTDVVPADKGSIDPSRVETRTDVQQSTDTTATKSLRDQISSALKGEDQTPPAASKDGVNRDEKGQFAPKDPAAQAAPVDPNAQVAPVDPNAKPSAVPVPAGLSPQEAQIFNSLPAELQTSFARTMETLNEKATRFAGYEAIEQMIAPRRQPWALNGMTDTQAINQLLALSDFAAEKPMEFVQYFIQQRGLDAEEIVFGAEPIDPTVQALQQQVADLTQQLTGVTTQQQQAAHNGIVNEIISFGTETGADGALLRPYFDELGNSVLPFVQAVMSAHPEWTRAQVLQEAYDRACWGTPSVRAKMQAASDTAASAARLAEQQEAAKRARAAGSSLPTGVPQGGNTPNNVQGGSLRDTIRAAVASAG